MKIDFYFSQLANRKFVFTNQHNIEVEGTAVSYKMSPMKAIVMSDGTAIPYQNFEEIAHDIGYADNYQPTEDDEQGGGFFDIQEDEFGNPIVESIGHNNEQGSMVTLEISNSSSPNRPQSSVQKNPIETLLSQAKLQKSSLTINIEALLPKSSLYETIIDSFGDESVDSIINFVLKSIDQKAIKTALTEAIKDKYNGDKPKIA